MGKYHNLLINPDDVPEIVKTWGIVSEKELAYYREKYPDKLDIVERMEGLREQTEDMYGISKSILLVTEDKQVNQGFYNKNGDTYYFSSGYIKIDKGNKVIGWLDMPYVDEHGILRFAEEVC